MTINATLRKEDFGSAGSRRLVRAGKLPAEIYGAKGNVHIVLEAHEFEMQLRKLPIGKECEVVVGAKTYKCVLQDLQENIMTGKLLHADFLCASKK